MRYIILYMLCMLGQLAHGQYWSHKALYKNYIWAPDEVTYDAALLADYFVQKHHTPAQRLHAAYNWITLHIRYSKDSSLYYNRVLTQQEKVQTTLRRRKGVCENYADLLVDIAQRMHIPAYVVYGYPQLQSSREGHAWCAAEIDGDWFLFDPTWDAAVNGMHRYFMVQPEIFLQTHMPFDPLWQLVEKPVGFKSQVLRGQAVFHYKDSVAVFLQLDSLQKYLAIERRMKHAGANNALLKLWQTETRMNIAMISGERDRQLYNDAVDKLNEATQLFNTFVSFRNNQFTPFVGDHTLRQMLPPIKKLLEEAQKALNQMGTIRENFQYDTTSVNQQLRWLHNRTEEQMQFVKQYLTTALPERIKLFYK